MNTVPRITPNSITLMNGLKNRPVFFLHFNGSRTPNLVVKGELKGDGHNLEDTKVSIAWSAKLMKNVNHSSVNTKILDPSELTAFFQFATRTFAPATPQYNNVVTERNTYVWVKMPFVAGLSDADMNTVDEKLVRPITRGPAVNTFEIKKVKAALGSLLNENVWVDLGKIVAVDVFNGNSDRFEPDTGEWANKGNVMFLQNGAGGAIGLDTYDSKNRVLTDNNAFSNLNTRGRYDSLQILINPGYRQNFARKCLTSVGEEFHRVFKKNLMDSATFNFGNDTSATIKITTAELKDFFVNNFLMDFQQGLTSGSNELKSYLQGKVRQYQTRANQPRAFGPGQHRTAVAVQNPAAPARPGTNAPMNGLPIGVMSRMQYLGW